MSQVGIEVDKLEKKIKKVVPGVIHVDLEVDKGSKSEKKNNLIIREERIQSTQN